MSEAPPEFVPRPLYVPAGNWLAQTVNAFCADAGLGNVAVSGIGSITDVWVLLNPDGNLEVRNFPGPGSFEMTSVLGNVVLRQGVAQYDVADLSTGQYPTWDGSVPTLNPYTHLHVTFAHPDFTIGGGHLLDAQVSIGAELMLFPRPVAGCAPGSPSSPLPADCIVSEAVSVPPFGTFSNWDTRWWFPPDRAR